MAPLTRSKAKRTSVQAEVAGLFDNLPLPALALIWQHLDATSRKSVFRVSRWGRDLVLREARTISLELQSKGKAATCKPLLRLLGRAVRAASPGLSLSVALRTAWGPTKTKHLSYLLRQAAQLPGWSSVSELRLKGDFREETPVVLSSFVPTLLQRLHLSWMSLAMEDFKHLATSTQLSSLRLDHCEMPAVPAGQNPLAALGSLRELCVCSSGSSIVRGLTQLTCLRMLSDRQDMADLLPVLAGMSQLNELELQLRSPGWVLKPDHVQAIIATSSQLRSLTLCHSLYQEQFDVLLTHATQLMSLTVEGLHLTEDRSQSPCTWKSFTIDVRRLGAHLLAFMPLHSLERLHTKDEGMCLPTQHPCYELPLWDCFLSWWSSWVPFEVPADLLHRALTNLERCPAWQQSGPCVGLRVIESSTPVYPAYFKHMLEALPALVSKSVHLNLYAPQVVMDGATVQDLSTAVGARLTGLILDACQLPDEFWPAMWAHLSGLQELTLGNDIASELTASSLVSYCKATTHPLQLELSQGWCTKLGGAGQLQQQLQQSGVTQVTVVPPQV